jgi:cyclomaltodextrinase / maltogenic alpha-amylase / neopullulanase
MTKITVFCLTATGLCLMGQTQPANTQAARKSAEFVRKARIYQIWPRSFTPEGTLRAAAARLSHVADLGATVVYLCPVMKQSTEGGISNPYRVSDYGAIDAEYGTEDDLRKFVAEAHALRMKVILDIVFAHMAADNPMVRRGEAKTDAQGRVAMSSWGTPQPDFTKPAVRRYLIDNMVHWVRDTGVDGYRCDVAPGVPLDFWEAARAELDRLGREVMLLAEGDRPDFHLRAFDVSYDFPYFAALLAVVRDGEPALRIRQLCEKTQARYPKGALRMRYNDNHDQDRADVVFGPGGNLATSVLNFTLDGTPLLYNGQEIGDTTPLFHDRPYPWRKDAYAGQTVIRWELGKPAPLIKVCNHVKLPAKQAQRFKEFQTLFRMRAREAALTEGEVVWVENSQPGHALSFLRRTRREEILVVVNLTNRRLGVDLELKADRYGALEKILDIAGAGTVSKTPDGRVTAALGAYGFVVGKRSQK